MADLQDALAAHHRPQAPLARQQSLYIAGAIGKFGEALIAFAASQPSLNSVWVAVEQALPSTEAKITPTVGNALPAGVDTALLVLSDVDAGLTYYGRDAIYRRVTNADLLARATALKAAGVRRLALVQPVDFWQQPESVRGLLASQDELAISLLGFETLLVVRPARQDDKPAAASRVQRVVDTYLRQFRWLAPARLPLTHRDVAAFVIERLLAGEPGVQVIEAGELEKLIYPARNRA
ncbi:MAG: hypothetical protein ACRCV9_07830 [Burkholderiaceae bacterium]